jgi:hypothetical protein
MGILLPNHIFVFKMNKKQTGILLVMLAPLLGVAAYFLFHMWAFWIAGDATDPNQSALFFGMLVLLFVWLGCVGLLIVGLVFLIGKEK